MTNREERFNELLNEEWKEVFRDSGTGNWQKHWFLDGEVAKVYNDESGMTFEAGGTFKDDSHHGVLWTNEIVEGDVRIEYEFTRLDHEHRCVNILYIQAEGIGEEPYKKDIKAWQTMRKVPAMSWYFEKMNTYHISYAAFENTDEVTPGYIRCRRYMGGPLEGTEVEPDYAPDDFFEPDVPHKIILIKENQELYFYVENANRQKLCYWKNNAFDPITIGRIGLRQMFTRKSRYKNIKLYKK